MLEAFNISLTSAAYPVQLTLLDSVTPLARGEQHIRQL